MYFYLDKYADDAAHDAAVQRDRRARGQVSVQLRLFFFHILLPLLLRARKRELQTFGNSSRSKKNTTGPASIS